MLTLLFTGQEFCFSILKREITFKTEVWGRYGEQTEYIDAECGRIKSSHNIQRSWMFLRSMFCSIISMYCHDFSTLFLKPFTGKVISTLLGGKALGISQNQAQKYATSCEMTVSSRGKSDWCKSYLLSFGEQNSRGKIRNSFKNTRIEGKLTIITDQKTKQHGSRDERQKQRSDSPLTAGNLGTGFHSSSGQTSCQIEFRVAARNKW